MRGPVPFFPLQHDAPSTLTLGFSNKKPTPPMVSGESGVASMPSEELAACMERRRPNNYSKGVSKYPKVGVARRIAVCAGLSCNIEPDL
jgi:hypothetical protein